jgi:RNA polymerase sigma-70 factor (sigma-E family)
MDADVADEPVVSDLDSFVRRRGAALFRYGFLLTGNRHDAADLVQEALVRVGARWQRVVAKGNPEAYVRTTMARVHVSRWRWSRRERLVDQVPEQGYREVELARIEEDSGLWRALATLPARQRTVLVMRYYEQRTDAEIGSALGIARGTVRSQAARGLDKLRAVWPAQSRVGMTEGDR